VQCLPGGLYACAAFYGSALEITCSWMQLLLTWLPESRFEADDRPALERYGDDSALDPETGRFACELCLPLRPV
jgi:AraC family transcriptional regulator